jgi:predicted nucleic acid-binding protein
MAYLIDTSVIAEYRKGGRCHPGVARFFQTVEDAELFLPVHAIGEIRAGIAQARRRKELLQAGSYEHWLAGLLGSFAGRIIEFDADCAQVWGALLTGERSDPHAMDKQIAAIAIVRDMTWVTRDRGFRSVLAAQVRLLDPFQD